MAPVPRSNSTAMFFSPSNNPKYVELKKHEQEVTDWRPLYEKAKSCDYSVEESSESLSNQNEALWNPQSCGFDYVRALNTKGRVDLNAVCLPSLEKQKKDLKAFFECREKELKAVEFVKPRPTENDDVFSSSNAAIPSKEESPPLCVDLGPHHEFESQECEPLAVQEEKENVKKAEDKAPVTCHSAPQENAKPQTSQVLKRHKIGKVKRNVIEVPCPETNQSPAKKLKAKKKNRKRKKGVIPKNHPKSKSSPVPCGYKCVDSGISAGSNASGTSDGQQSGEYTTDGTYSSGGGGGGGFCQKKGMGGNGRDEKENKNPLSAEDVEMEEEDEEDEKDKKDATVSSKEGSDMDCQEGQPVTHSVPWETFRLETQHLQHGCYCSNDNCPRRLCKEAKGEVKHLKNHQDNGGCLRCHKTNNLVKLHAATCKKGYCRVVNCNSLREDGVDNQPVHIPLPPPPPQPQLPTRSDIDGYVVLDNTGQNLKHQYFQEHIDYIKGEEIGKGGNGNVYKVYFPTSSPFYNNPMVVKETGYPLMKDEKFVYELVDHPNFVKTYFVAMKGTNGHASIFMEQCDKSLKDLYQEQEGRKMDDKQAMFYFQQVVDAVVHLHAAGFIHKDIKAQNILLSGLPGSGEYFRAKLADFDSAKKLSQEFTEAGLKPMGTRGFTAPEVLASQPHGRPADVFNLGGLCLELKGLYPRQDQLREQIQELIGIQPFLGNVVQCCMQEDYSRRPTALQLQRYLNHCVPDELA